MIFYCFSSKDRHDIVEAMLFHVTNYNLPVWYDRHKMLMGDDRDYKNFIEGVEQCEYAVVILSPNAIESVCAREEIELIHQRYVKQNMTVFPVFFNISAIDVPEEFCWMKSLVYKELTVGNDAASACNHIICKVLLDELEKYPIKSVQQFLDTYGKKPMYCYVTKLLQAYHRISDDNKNAQIALLYAVSSFICEAHPMSDIPAFYTTGIDRLFDTTRLNLPIDLRESLIFERLTLLLINASIFGYIIKDRNDNL